MARSQLLALPGVGEETADAILLYALLHPVPVVDEYLRRITARHGLAPRERKYGEVQQLVAVAFSTDPPEFRQQLLNEFHALVVAVGKNHCGPKPRCEGCPLAVFHG
jgi:endonuclease III related protein